MNERIANFVTLSASLTGCNRVQLQGTGMADQYIRTLDASLPSGFLDELLNAYKKIPQESITEAALEMRIFSDLKFGPVARNVILLWYCGTWTALPAEWHTSYGTSAIERVGVVSAQAYRAGLQWAIIGAHAPGSSQQGFASWSSLPQEVLL